jgi:putative acetyltransferase
MWRSVSRWRALATASIGESLPKGPVNKGREENTGLRRVSTGDSVILRRENPEERGAVRSLNEAAFGRQDEADLVDRLRDEGAVLASFVAELEKRIVGHILFSRMLIETASGPISAVALAPMAVLPEHQRRGVGGQLIRHGLDWLRQRGEHVVIVLGHPDYYSRFGFSSDRARSLASPFPPEAFMALELLPGALDGIRGSVRYPDAFS